MENGRGDIVNALGKLTISDWLSKDRGRLITSIRPNLIGPSANPVTSKGGHVLLCSYNWLASNSKAIYIPGGAPILKESVQVPFTLTLDKGREMVDPSPSTHPPLRSSAHSVPPIQATSSTT